MASAGGGFRHTGEIREVEMEIVEPPLEEPRRARAKRPRDEPGPYGLFRVATAEKKLTDGSQALQDYNALRLSSLSSGEDSENRIRMPSKINNSEVSPDLRYRTLIHAYGEGNKRFAHLAGTQNSLTHQGEHPASYTLPSFKGFGNPVCTSSDHSLGSPKLGTTLRTTLPSHQFTRGTGLYGYGDVDTGPGISRPVLLESCSPQVSTLPVELLSPIKDEVWETSVPFVPSFDFPYSIPPSRSLYDPFIDSVEPSKVEIKKENKSADISSSIINQHASQIATNEKLLNYDDKLTMLTKGLNDIASDKVCSSSLDVSDLVKTGDRKNYAASVNEKTKEFRFHLAEHVKELIKPIWKEGYLSKDAHKLIVKKAVDKVINSIQPNQVPATEEMITNYLNMCGSKIEKLVKAYVDKHGKA
ncbi:hypothetical protein ACP4OV_030984 [Aristida adscensionis]